ncbi:MAG: hypothetical protein JWN23_354 [Rhodocyclales bacterium]|nr:hypothetical protein [Rhodocyclales bacterium]
MSIRAISLAMLVALGLGACEKAEDEQPAPAAEAAQSVPMAAPDSSSGAVAEMQSAALDAQDATAALTDAASAAVGMATEAGKKQ